MMPKIITNPSLTTPYPHFQASPSPCSKLKLTAKVVQVTFEETAQACENSGSSCLAEKVKVQSTSYWDYVYRAARVAKTIGSGIVSYGKKGADITFSTLATTATISKACAVQTAKTVAMAVVKAAHFVYEEVPGVKTVTHMTAQAAVSIGASCYQNIPGAKVCAAFITRKALKKLLPQKGVLKNEITTRREELDNLTKSSICRETCRLISSYAAAYLQHQILNGEKIDSALRPDFVKALFCDSKSEPKYGFLGDALKLAIQEHPEIISEIIEANLLKMFSKLIVKLKGAEEENKNWLADLTKELFDGYTEDLQKLQIASPATLEQEEKHLVGHLSKALMKIVLPQKEADFEIPISGFSLFSAALMKELEKAVLPKIVKFTLTELSTDYCRDKLFLKFLQKAQLFFQKGTFSSSSKDPHPHRHEEAPPREPYPNQEAFNESLSAFTATALEFFDSENLALLKVFQPEKLIGANGKLLSDVLTQFDIMSLCNQGLELLLPALNNGRWNGEDKGVHQEFLEAHFAFNSTKEDLEKEKELRKEKHEELHRQTKSLLATFTSDFSGLTAMGAEKMIGSPKLSKDEIQKVMQTGSFLEQCKLCTQLLLLNAIKAILIFICKVFGKKTIQEAGYALHKKVELVNARQAIRPLTSILARKL